MPLSKTEALEAARVTTDRAQPVEIDDVQSLVTSDLRRLSEATFLMFRIDRPLAATPWLGWIAEQVERGAASPAGQVVNVAFTHAGLERLGLETRALRGFSQPFREGMTGTAWRTRRLGDHGDCAPEHWVWGNENTPVHALVLLYAVDTKILTELQSEHERRAHAGGLAVVSTLPTQSFQSPFKEPFGFADGISQPPIAGIDPKGYGERPVATGEFLLGYRNEAGNYPPGPTVTADEATAAAELAPAEWESRRDFGRNGSYLVFRQLEQDVSGFWRLVAAQAESVGSLEKRAAKMIGRWPSGAPLVLSPEKDDTTLGGANDFDYRKMEDDRGLRCPLGAHIRRANPRDSLTNVDAYHSLDIVRQHRILRRSRGHGRPLAGWPDPRTMLEQANEEDWNLGRGLSFVCLNADLEQQFEFIQERWMSNPTFVSANSGEVDPVVGNQRPGATFTVPMEPVPVSFGGNGTPLSRFVTVRGGAYFFLPSKRALRYLAELSARRQ